MRRPRHTLKMWVITVHRETVGLISDVIDRLLLILTSSILVALVFVLFMHFYAGTPWSLFLRLILRSTLPLNPILR